MLAPSCLPLLVLPSALAATWALPYTRWLDYCTISFVVFESTLKQRRSLQFVVERLLRVSEAEAEAMRRELRRVRHAFVFRPGSSAHGAPSAAEYIIDEACHAASAVAQAQAPDPDASKHLASAMERTLDRCAIR